MSGPRPRNGRPPPDSGEPGQLMYTSLSLQHHQQLRHWAEDQGLTVPVALGRILERVFANLAKQKQVKEIGAGKTVG